jgi:hypothetical protein
MITLSRIDTNRYHDLTPADFSTPIQIVISFIQVVSGMAVTFKDVLPDFFSRLRDVFSFLALDLINIFDFGCTLSAQNQLISLLLSTLLPLGVCLALFTTHILVERRWARNDRAFRQLLRTTTFTTFLIINFLVYPSSSNIILATFACRTLDDGSSVLVKDPSVSCQSPVYARYLVYAVFMLFVYPAGIPALYGTLLYRWRRQL